MNQSWNARSRVPFATSARQRLRMQAQRRQDTAPELALRRALYRLGLRYRIQRRPVPAVPRRADVVFPREKVAIYVDGCFWHGCPEHGTVPSANTWYWPEKIRRNRRRDRDTDRRLREADWKVVRVWEHEDPVSVALSVQRMLDGRRVGRSERS